jgi:RecA-family ATPase
MNLLNDWCKKENKTILMIHHHSKGESGSVRGATAFIDAVRLHYVISKKEISKTKDDVIVDDSKRVLKIEKSNHFWGKDEFEIQLFEKKENDFKKDEDILSDIEIIDSTDGTKLESQPKMVQFFKENEKNSQNLLKQPILNFYNIHFQT